MARSTLQVLVVVLLLSACGSSARTPTPSPIKHVVVLMLENRSFDHMLGWLHLENAEIDGLNGTEYNQIQAFNAASPKIFVNQDGFNVSPDDPKHDFYSTTEQIFGYEKRRNTTAAPLMNGFVQNAFIAGHNVTNPMSMFTRRAFSAPVINTLASEFAVFDRWFASVPGPVRGSSLSLARRTRSVY